MGTPAHVPLSLLLLLGVVVALLRVVVVVVKEGTPRTMIMGMGISMVVTRIVVLVLVRLGLVLIGTLLRIAAVGNDQPLIFKLLCTRASHFFTFPGSSFFF